MISVIQSGWPHAKHELDPVLKPFWDHRDELSVTNNLVLKGQRIVIPFAMQSMILKKLHAAHQGMVRTKQLARDLVFWPGINGQIEDMVSRCSLCQTFRNYQAKEPLLPLEAPSEPWSQVAVDLFTHDDKKFVIIVDYYSEWFEFEQLGSTTGPNVINAIRKVFATHGIPQKVISDNGPPFNSALWKKFASDYDFEHILMSPKHSQTNGLVERAVGIVKALMKKGPQDLTLALLNIRNTPQAIVGSPAQRLLGRRTRTLIPTLPNLLQPKTVESETVQNAKNAQRSAAKQYYDRNAHHLPTLNPGDSVRYRDEQTKTWKPALLLPDKVDYPRSHKLLNEKGHVLRRNRCDLLKTREPPDYFSAQLEEFDEDPPSAPPSVPSQQLQPQQVLPPVPVAPPLPTVSMSPTPSAPIPIQTSSGRLSKPPVKFKDYVC